MSDVSRREAVRITAGLAVAAGLFGSGQVFGRDPKPAAVELDAVLAVPQAGGRILPDRLGQEPHGVREVQVPLNTSNHVAEK
jgi:hypothetical protein